MMRAYPSPQDPNGEVTRQEAPASLSSAGRLPPAAPPPVQKSAGGGLIKSPLTPIQPLLNTMPPGTQTPAGQNSPQRPGALANGNGNGHAPNGYSANAPASVPPAAPVPGIRMPQQPEI